MSAVRQISARVGMPASRAMIISRSASIAQK